jgi:gluconolactonase
MIAALLIATSILSAGELYTGEPVLIEDSYTFTEGPLWLPEQEKWIFSDVADDTIFDSNGEKHLKPSKNTNGLALDNDGNILACQSGTHSIVRLERNGKTTVLASHFDGKPLNSTDDLVVRSDGIIFFTDPKSLRKDDTSELGFSGLYALDPEKGTIKLLSKDLKYPNGIGLSPDESTLYVADTTGAGIFAFTIGDNLDVTASGKLCEVNIPDGLAIDKDGNIWTSSSRGIAIFDDSGKSLGDIRTGAMPTNCAFGGTDGTTLLITARKKVFALKTNTTAAQTP